MVRKTKNGLILIFTLLLLLCCERNIDIDFRLTLLNHDDSPIEGASIEMDHKMLGQSDKNGLFKAIVSIPENQNILNIVARKESADYYYAPFKKKIELNQSRHIAVSGVLYRVPKPTLTEKQNEDLNKNDIADKKDLSIAKNSYSPDEKDPSKLNNNLAKPTLPVVENEASKAILTQPIEKSTLTSPSFTSETENKITFFITDIHKKNIPNAQIYYGFPSQKERMLACTTNIQGRCFFTLKSSPEQALYLLTQAKGFQSKILEHKLAAKDIIRIQLNPGRELVVKTLQKNLSQKLPLNEVSIFLDNKKLGTTDIFGSFYAPIEHKIDDLIHVKLVHSKFNDFSTNFTVTENMYLEKEFFTSHSDTYSLYVEPMSVASTFSDYQGFLKNDEIVHLNKKIIDLFSTYNQKNHTDNNYKIKPTLILNKKENELELAISSPDKTFFSYKFPLTEPAKLTDHLKKAADELTKHLPIATTISAKEHYNYKAPIGKKKLSTDFIGKYFKVYGNKINESGSTQKNGEIALLRLDKIEDNESYFSLVKKDDRSPINIGDALILTDLENKKDGLSFAVADEDTKKPLSYAQVYVEKKWVGTTSKDGKISIDILKYPTKVEIVKEAYPTTTKDIVDEKSTQIELSRGFSLISIETDPERASLFLEEKKIGTTPIYKAVIPAKDTKLTIKKDESFKNFELTSAGTNLLDFTGPNKILLEKDYLSSIRKHIENKEFTKAEDTVKDIALDHSDFNVSHAIIADAYFQKGQYSLAKTHYDLIFKEDHLSLKERFAFFAEKNMLISALNHVVTNLELEKLNHHLEKNIFEKSFDELLLIEKTMHQTHTKKPANFALIRYYKASTKQFINDHISEIATLDLKSLWLDYLNFSENDPNNEHKQHAEKHYRLLTHATKMDKKI